MKRYFVTEILSNEVVNKDNLWETLERIRNLVTLSKYRIRVIIAKEEREDQIKEGEK